MPGRDKIIIKTPEEIEGIRRASRLTAMVLDMIGQYVQPGISTEELDHICNTFTLENGGVSACTNYLGHNRWGKGGYPKCTCISVNEVVCHGIPSKTQILKEGDILNIDVTSIVDGYFGDASRMYTVGKISDKARKLINVTRECMELGIGVVKPGARMGDIGAIITEHAERAGFSVVREYTGHGTGVYFHELPDVYHRAAKGTGAVMEPGMTFTIEPMINLGGYKTKLMDDDWTVKTQDGQLSAQFEHTILVTDIGHEILTIVK